MLNDPFLKDDTEFDDKIKAPINQNNNDDQDSSSQPPIKHSDDYKRGWRDGIKDVLDKKIDPTNYTPKEAKNDYDEGYNDVLIQIKNGLKNGITLNKSNKNTQNNSSSDLADIPWDIPPQGGSGGKKSDKNNDNKSDSPSDSDIDDMDADEAADTAKDMADKAKDAADKAKGKAESSGSDSDKADADKAQDAADAAADAAKEAQDAAKNGDTKGAQNAAKDARDAKNKAEAAAGSGKGNTSDSDIDKMSGDKAASTAKDMADKAQDAADKAKAKAASSKSDSDKADADKAQDFADEAKKAAEKSKKAAEKGDTKGAQEAAKSARDAKEAAENIANNSSTNGSLDSSSKGDSSHVKGNGHFGDNKGNVPPRINIPKEDLEKITKNAEAQIEKYKNKISGDFGKFIEKCRASVQLKESGLAVNVQKGGNGWNSKLNKTLNVFVKQRIQDKKKRFKSSYSRVKRGSGFVKFGQPLQPGKVRIKEMLTISIAIYIDISGSMAGCIDDVFKATYIICDAIKKNYGRDQVVEDITFKIYGFDTNVYPIRYGQKSSVGGGTMPFDELFEYIHRNTQNELINIIITDAEQDAKQEVIEKILDESDGLFVFITNGRQETVRQISESQKYKLKLTYITASAQFEID